ncbi:MAG: branched-chain amino acid ABC transporter permease [Desulfurococcales archaeon]|nr:branched-chain amino acid ABC transporter permease [Desulfurococcales archaeon]
MSSTVVYGTLGAIFNGLLVGSLYSMMALGLSLIYRVTKIPNFAYAEYITYGSYFAYVAAVSIPGSKGLIPALLLGLISAALIALASDELGFKPLWKKGATPLQLLVASIGVGLILRYGLLGLIVLVIGSRYLEIATPQRSSTIFTLGGLASFTTAHALAISTAILLAAGLWFLFTRTKIGKGMRATASNPTLARISGINIYAMRRLAWLLAGGLAGFSGFVYAYYNVVNPESGWLMLLWIFAAAIMGGFTFFGVMIAGVILGLAQHVISFYGDLYLGVGAKYSPVIALVTLVLVLLFRPEGVIRMEALAVRRA